MEGNNDVKFAKICKYKAYTELLDVIRNLHPQDSYLFESEKGLLIELFGLYLKVVELEIVWLCEKKHISKESFASLLKECRKKDESQIEHMELEAWQPRYCHYLLLEAKRMHEAAIKPPPIKDEKGNEILEYMRVHCSDNTGKRALCGQKDAVGYQLKNRAEFEKLPARVLCDKCLLSLRKIKGEDTLHYNLWLKRESQGQLVIDIYEAAGRKINEWISLTELLPRTEFKTRPALLRAVKGFCRRGIVETEMIKHKFYVRLILDCVKQLPSGKLIKSFDKAKNQGLK